MRNTIVEYVIRELVAACTKSVGYDFFFVSLESTGERMNTVVMKNIFPLRYEIHY